MFVVEAYRNNAPVLIGGKQVDKPTEFQKMQAKVATIAKSTLVCFGLTVAGMVVTSMYDNGVIAGTTGFFANTAKAPLAFLAPMGVFLGARAVSKISSTFEAVKPSRTRVVASVASLFVMGCLYLNIMTNAANKN